MADKLTKAEIVESMYEKTNMDRLEITNLINMFFDEIKQGLCDGKTLEFRGFGTFELRTRKGRECARNPKTGEKVSFEDHNTVIFRPGRELKNSVWKKK